MTAATKDEIERAAHNALSKYPLVAQYVQAGDPRTLAQIGAQASMLAMLSEQVDVAQFEPFVKSRDGTVLSDAALRGVLPLARSCRVELVIANHDTANFLIDAGRRFVDPKGRVFEADAWAVIPANGTGTVTCTQRTTRIITHTVGDPVPFYRVEVDQTDEQVYLSTLELWKGADAFTYAPDWFNVAPGDLAYQLETDERRKLWICLGSDTVVGYGAKAGDKFEIRLTECEGRIGDLMPGAEFNLEYIYTPTEGKIKATIQTLLEEGSAPLTMPELRVISRYPAIYDHNAVYLGEFDFLLRRYLTNIRFLSVWNEQVEETVRGPNVDNVNKLFFSGLVTGMPNAQFEARVTELIKRADDSYRIQFVPAVLTPVAVNVDAKVASVHDVAAVEAQIRSILMSKYGDGAKEVSKGLSMPIRRKTTYRLLRENVAALRDELSDFELTITLPATVLPEMFLHITAASLTVTVTRAAFNTGTWNY